MKYILGKTLKYDVVNGVGLVVVAANTVIEYEHIELMKQHDIDEFSLVLLAANGKTRSHTNLLALQVVDQCMALFKGIQYSRKIPVMEFKNVIVPTLQKIANDPDIFRLFEAIKAKDNYTYEHNVGVGVLATLIGKWMNLPEAELASLSLAAILHDVGKVRVPTEILVKPDKLTDEENQVLKAHTVFGYELLKNTVGISHRMALVALQHHEKEDGSGYPFGLGKDRIDTFSKIVAVADIFHAMSSKRPHHEAIPFFEIVSQMRHETFGKLEPYIVSMFISNITKRLVGKKVLLTDGRAGEVVLINPSNDVHPLIKVEDSFIDLSTDSSVKILEIIM
jgi:HD-GYP domain-containing protein (c-di-GMP phosphodiesterase class II)